LGPPTKTRVASWARTRWQSDHGRLPATSIAGRSGIRGGGIGSLTMRKLGRALGVEAMSLYKHVANKDDVLDGLVGLVEGEIELPSSPGLEGGHPHLRDLGPPGAPASPLGCSLIMTRFRPARVRYMDWLLGRLRGAGFSPQLAYHAYHALDSHIPGFTMWEAGHSVDTEDRGRRRNLPPTAAHRLLSPVRRACPTAPRRAGPGRGGVRVRARPDPGRPPAAPGQHLTPGCGCLRGPRMWDRPPRREG
jgi:AcrR family transcriptional regulator